MATSWFQVLYSVKKKFTGLDDFKATVEAAHGISMISAGDGGKDDPRIERLKKYLNECQMLDDNGIYAMLDSMKDEHIELVSEAVKKVYNTIDGVELSEDMREVYRDVLTQIIESNGLYINKKKRVYDDSVSDMMSDEDITKVIESFNKLKNDEKSLQNIVEFIYTNNFQNVSYKLITDNNEDLGVPNDVLIAPYIINSLVNVSEFDDDAKMKYYSVLISSKFKSDEDMLDKISTYNRGYVDLSEADSLLGNILENYPEHGNIAYETVTNAIESTKDLRTNAKELYDMFGKKFTSPTLEMAIEHVIGYIDDEPVLNSIVTSDETLKNAISYIDEFITLIFEKYTDELKSVDDKINQYNKEITEDFTAQTKVINLKMAVKLWSDFFQSGMYRYYGGMINDALTEKLNMLMSKNDYSVRYRGKDVNIFKKEFPGEVFVKLINVVNELFENETHDYEKIVDYLSVSFDKADLHVLVQIQVELVLLKFLVDLFKIDYKSYKDFDEEIMLKNKDYCFDGICNLIYTKDKFIKESVVFETLFFGDYLITEGEDKKVYFDKLAEKIKKTDDDIVKYVGNNKDNFEENSTENTDSSTGENNLSREQINTLEKNADELKTAVQQYGK